MIPQALTLKGFLSFRDEQRLDFDWDQVWLLSGPNGSGKSTVFDAILFALYAGHRAGKADLHELINKDCDRATVRFDFVLDGHRYRAERIADRVADKKTGRPGYTATQQLYAWDDAGTWQPIPGTHRHGDFQEWVREHVGLSFDAFTSSALLMQGRADVLVAQDAEAARRRFEVLARIVGLDYYERLHRQADDQRRKSERRVGELKAQLEVIEPVDPARLDELTQRGSDLARERSAAEQELDRLHGQRLAAATWAELRKQRAQKQIEWDTAAHLLGDAVAIERDGARWQELHALLPFLQRVVDLQKQVTAASTQTAALEAQRRQLAAREADAGAALERVRQAQAELDAATTGDERQQAELVAGQQRLKLALGPLGRLNRRRESLHQAKALAAASARELRLVEARLERATAELAPLALAVQTAVQAHRDAGHEATTARARYHDFAEQAQRFAAVAGAQVCSYCGQELTADHAERERTRIAGELATRKAAWERAQQAVQAAVHAESARSVRHQAGDKALAALRTRAEAVRRDHDKAVSESQVHAQAIDEALTELPPAYRQRIDADPAFPSADDLAALTRELAALDAQLKELQRTRAERTQTLNRLRQQHQQGERDRAAITTETRRVETAMAQQTERAASGQQQLDQARAALPVRWQYRADNLDDAAVQQWSAELRRLAAGDAAGRLDQLRRAQAAQAPLRQQLEQLDAELTQIPAESRREPAELDPLIRTVHQRANDLRAELSDLQADQRQLLQRQERREQLLADFRAADRRRHLTARLAELLSRRHLQRHLLRQAEVGIVENTNRVLDRISAGQLSVRLLPEESNDDSRALQLDAYKPAAGQSFGLSFLSGSERFRVAIGLALGIGQYASRQHRAIESVIIDEGFGCLDRDNRRTMIDELDHLRGQLRCIVLVSHQEEFADAFPEGYRFHIAEGTSRVERSEA